MSGVAGQAEATPPGDVAAGGTTGGGEREAEAAGGGTRSGNRENEKPAPCQISKQVKVMSFLIPFFIMYKIKSDDFQCVFFIISC